MTIHSGRQTLSALAQLNQNFTVHHVPPYSIKESIPTEHPFIGEVYKKIPNTKINQWQESPYAYGGWGNPALTINVPPYPIKESTPLAAITPTYVALINIATGQCNVCDTELTAKAVAKRGLEEGNSYFLAKPYKRLDPKPIDVVETDL